MSAISKTETTHTGTIFNESKPSQSPTQIRFNIRSLFEKTKPEILEKPQDPKTREILCNATHLTFEMSKETIESKESKDRQGYRQVATMLAVAAFVTAFLGIIINVTLFTPALIFGCIALANRLLFILTSPNSKEDKLKKSLQEIALKNPEQAQEAVIALKNSIKKLEDDIVRPESINIHYYNQTNLKKLEILREVTALIEPKPITAAVLA